MLVAPTRVEIGVCPRRCVKEKRCSQVTALRTLRIGQPLFQAAARGGLVSNMWGQKGVEEGGQQIA